MGSLLIGRNFTAFSCAVSLSTLLLGCNNETQGSVADTANNDIAATVEAGNLRQDLPTDSLIAFSCTSGPDFAFRFLGPETILLSFDARDYVLQRERTASGARYTGEGISVWNKGDEAMFVAPDGDYRCMRINTTD